MRVPTVSLLFCGLLSLTIVPVLRAASLYTVQHIPGLAGNFTVRMNDLTQIVAGRTVWSGGGLTDLGGLGGTLTIAESINNAGQVVGRSYQPGNIMRAFLWQNGTMTALPNLGGEEGYATAINNRGEIAGYTDFAPGVSLEEFRATFWTTSHTAVDVGTVGTDLFSMGFAINNAGHVAGISAPSSASGFGRDAFVWNGSTRTPFIENDDGSTTVVDMNDSDTVVGIHNGLAYLWQTGAIVELGTLGGPGSSANAINNAGQIVGTSFDGSTSQAFLYEDGHMLDLRTLVDDAGGWSSLTEAWDINSSGQIVGFGTFNGSRHEGFLLTPVPEPASVSFLLAGAGAASLRRARKRAGADLRRRPIHRR